MINDLLGKVINGKYRIDSLIRETEIGDFYRGTNISTGMPLTIKILAPAMAIDVRYVDRFLTETKAASAISHRNILNTIDVGTDEQGLPFAIFEAAEGESLTSVLGRDGIFTEPRAIGLASQIASALTAAHARDVIHGGLNLDKILIRTIDDEETVKIYDIGVRSHARNSLSAVAYLAPEQCIDVPTADHRSDIYSLGVILYEMVAGEPPFTGPTPADVIRKQRNEPPAPLSAFRQDLHPQLEPIILSAIAPDPERRYQLMSDLAEDLGQLASETGASVPAPAMAASAPGGTRRNIWQTAFIVFVGIAVLAGALIYATYTRQTNPTASLQPDANSSPVQPINPATGAQEEAMLKLGDLGDASMIPNANMELPPGTMPGGDGYNAWQNGGVPPAGAPLPGAIAPQSPGMLPPAYVPPGGQTVTIDPNGGSQFMPNDGGVILVPIPANTEPAAKPTPTPKTPPANTTVKPTPDPKATPAANPAGTRADTTKPNAKASTTPSKKP